MSLLFVCLLLEFLSYKEFRQKSHLVIRVCLVTEFSWDILLE